MRRVRKTRPTKSDGNELSGLWPDPHGIADGVFEAGTVIEEVDFHTEEKNGDIPGGEGGKTDGVFLRGDQGEAAASAGAGKGIFHLSDGEAVVVGKGALVNDFGTEFDEALQKTFRHGNTSDGADPKASEIRKGFGFPGDHVLQMEGVMGAGKNLGVAVVATDLFFQFGLILALAFGEKDEVGPLESIGRFAEDSAGKDMAVPKGILAVDEEEIKTVTEAEVLVTVIEQEGVGAVVTDGVAGGFHPVGIDENGNAGKVACEHEGFVAGLGGVEQDGFITAAEDGDAATGFLERAGEFFDHGGLAGTADGEVADADDEGADRVTAEDGIMIEAGAEPHDAGVDGGEEKKKGLQEGGSPSSRTVEDDVGGELLEGFEGFQSHGLSLGVIVYVYDYV